jgi:5-methylcytosine-specific restriction endonuclease McrA
MMIGRPKSEIRARARLIRTDLLRRYDTNLLRAELRDEQGENCFLCGKPIQSSDSILCEIEHAIPVELYAEFDWSIEQACSQANDRKNLFAAHPRCNKSKRNRDYEEWLEQGGREHLREVSPLREEEIARLRKELTERSRKGGRKQALTGTGMFASQHRGKGGRIGGLIAGRIAVESGHLARIRRKNIQSGLHAHISALGARVRNALHGNPATPESCAKAGRISNHLRWHVRRGIVNPNCELCKPSEVAR